MSQKDEKNLDAKHLIFRISPKGEELVAVTRLCAWFCGNRP